MEEGRQGKVGGQLVMGEVVEESMVGWRWEEGGDDVVVRRREELRETQEGWWDERRRKQGRVKWRRDGEIVGLMGRWRG